MRNAVFTIDVAGEPRSVFSVQERASATSPFSSTVEHWDWRSRARMSGYAEPSPLVLRYSLHRSDESPTGINVLKRTIVSADGERSDGGNYTRAIKNTKRFTLLHSHRAMDLSDPRYTLGKNRGTVFSLRSYDPSVSSCSIKIWAGPAEREFSYYRVTDDLKLIQQRFAAFRLAIMWCFLTLPSDVTSSWQSYETKTDSELAAIESPGKGKLLRMVRQWSRRGRCYRRLPFDPTRNARLARRSHGPRLA